MLGDSRLLAASINSRPREWLRSTEYIVVTDHPGRERREPEAHRHTSTQAHRLPCPPGNSQPLRRDQAPHASLTPRLPRPASRPGLSTSAPVRLCVGETSPGTAARQAFRQVTYTFHAGRYASGRLLTQRPRLAYHSGPSMISLDLQIPRLTATYIRREPARAWTVLVLVHPTL